MDFSKGLRKGILYSHFPLSFFKKSLIFDRALASTSSATPKLNLIFAKRWLFGRMDSRCTHFFVNAHAKTAIQIWIFHIVEANFLNYTL